MRDIILYRRGAGHVKERPTRLVARLGLSYDGRAMRTGDSDIPRFREAILAWYDANRRDLPWRATSDPYAIWASEVMLQQTQVSRVAEYWPRFIERFPTVNALAEASPGDVLAEWSGLGYYRRARMFQSAARVVVNELGGVLPPSARDLCRLPGMGNYTSAAVASIGLGEAVPAVDANAARVLARVLGLKGDVSRADKRRTLEHEARRLLDPERPGDFNQAIMELGALACSPAAPDCRSCPIARFCVAGASSDPAAYPGPTAPVRSIALREAVGVVTRGARLLLAVQKHERGWWQGLWTLPRCPLDADEDAVTALAAAIRKRFGVGCRFEGERFERKYGVTRHRVTAVVLRGVWGGGDLIGTAGGKWISLDGAARLGLPAPHRAILDLLLEADASVPEHVGEHERCDD